MKRALLALACIMLQSCSFAVSRGVDPRDNGPASGNIGSGPGNPNAVGVVAGPMFWDWLRMTFMPNKRDDVPPPPPPPDLKPDVKSNLEVDCTDPAKHPDKDLKCK